jgi:hypothetical protein
MRIKCFLLAWKTLKLIVDKKNYWKRIYKWYNKIAVSQVKKMIDETFKIWYNIH